MYVRRNNQTEATEAEMEDTLTGFVGVGGQERLLMGIAGCFLADRGTFDMTR